MATMAITRPVLQVSGSRGAREVAAVGVGAVGVGAVVGGAVVGGAGGATASDVGSSDVGSSDVGSSDVGSSDVGSSAMVPRFGGIGGARDRARRASALHQVQRRGRPPSSPSRAPTGPVG
jgi:hypothetical protein